MADRTTVQNAQRKLALEKQRILAVEQFNQQREQIKKENKVSLDLDKFVKQSEDINSKLAKDTIGLVKLDQFQKIRASIEQGSLPERRADQLQKQKKRLQSAAERLSFNLDEAGLDEEQVASAKQQPIADAPATKTPSSSPLDNHNDAEHTNGSADSTNNDRTPEVQTPSPSAEASPVIKRPRRLGMDPTAKSYFESDKERAAEAERLRLLVEAELLTMEEKAKNEQIKLACSFWDGADHRFVVACRKGDTIRQFLGKCQQAYAPLRSFLTENLMYVKENVIIPLDMTFYELISKGARNRTTPLYTFTIGEDNVEADLSRSGKVFGKQWYERNRHLYPAKQWLHFDSNRHFPLSPEMLQYRP